MNLVFLGPPGAGKGTQAARLSQKAGIPHVSTGDLFRNHIKNQTELGKKIKAVLDAGDLVPDEVTTELVRQRIKERDAAKGFILDGFPRTIPQAEALESIAAVRHVLLFDLTEDEIVIRLSGRRVALASGRVYHIVFNPPKKEGVCDVSGEKLVIRPDDDPSAIRNRLKVYRNLTEPLVDFYKHRGLLNVINAAQSGDEVFLSVCSVLGLG